MGHFAKVLQGKVINVIVAEPEFFDTFVDSSPGEWIQTSYNTRGNVYYKPDSDEQSEDQSKALRANYAGIGHIYDATNDVFYEPQPYPSWSLNTETWIWEPPIPKPLDGKSYYWNEEIKNWEPLNID
jgi:hypothetical protein